MRRLIAHLLAVACLMGPGVAIAAPAPSAFGWQNATVSAPVIDVRDGCGPYRHRGPGGYCRPNGPPPRPFFRACPFGFHPTPYGCRRNY